MCLLMVMVLSTTSVNEVRATQAPTSVGVSTPEQVDHTYFLILELTEEPEEEEERETVKVTVTVYDNVTKEPIGEIVVELYYEQAKDPITGSDGWYLTDVDGNILYELSEDTVGDWYHFEINTPGYYPYYGDEFELTGDMHFDIYLDPIEDENVPDPEPDPEPGPEPDLEPDLTPDPDLDPLPDEDLNPEPEATPDDDLSDIPQTGDNSIISFNLFICLLSLGLILYLLFNKEDEDDEDMS